MKNNSEEKYILFNESNKIEEFIEGVCNKNHLYNYMGSISMVLNAAFNIANEDIKLSFEQCVGGVLFSITANEQVFKDISLDKDSSLLEENQLLIKMLTDEVNIVNKGKTMEMIFYVNGIAPELLTQRKEKINEYFSHNVEINKATKHTSDFNTSNK